MKTITDVCDCRQYRQYLDLHLPEAESFPVLVFFHGSGLEQGGHCAYVRAVEENGVMTHPELMPIELQFDAPVWRGGNPRFSADHGIIERLAEMSAPYGTSITVDHRGCGIVELK